MQQIRILQATLDNLTMDEALQHIDYLIRQKTPSYVVTPNMDHLAKLETLGELRAAYAEAALVLADGMPLLWIARSYKTPLKEKVSGSDLLPEICKLACEKNYRIFFLGAAQGIAAEAANRLERQYPGLQIAGTYSPPFGFENDEEEVNKAIACVKKGAPDILIVGLGCPKQEIFMHRYKSELNVPVSLGLGASIDFEAGSAKRAPRLMQNLGLEWLHRLLGNPKRLGRRYLIDDTKTLFTALRHRPSRPSSTSQNKAQSGGTK
ncbi:MAG: WecB/TagA/CpsF family glycosyltransferase [Gordonibacter sp.]